MQQNSSLLMFPGRCVEENSPTSLIVPTAVRTLMRYATKHQASRTQIHLESCSQPLNIPTALRTATNLVSFEVHLHSLELFSSLLFNSYAITSLLYEKLLEHWSKMNKTHCLLELRLTSLYRLISLIVPTGLGTSKRRATKLFALTPNIHSLESLLISHFTSSANLQPGPCSGI